MPQDASPRSTGASELLIQDLQLLVETLCWLAAWLLLPAWLAFRGAGATGFLLYALGAGMLLSAGIAADRSDAFEQRGDIAWFAAVSCLAVLVVGGGVFTLTSALR